MFNVYSIDTYIYSYTLVNNRFSVTGSQMLKFEIKPFIHGTCQFYDILIYMSINISSFFEKKNFWVKLDIHEAQKMVRTVENQRSEIKQFSCIYAVITSRGKAQQSKWRMSLLLRLFLSSSKFSLFLYKVYLIYFFTLYRKIKQELQDEGYLGNHYCTCFYGSSSIYVANQDTDRHSRVSKDPLVSRASVNWILRSQHPRRHFFYKNLLIFLSSYLYSSQMTYIFRCTFPS